MRHEEDETRRTWATRTKWFQESAPQATHKSRDQRDLRLWLYSRRRSIKIPHVTTDKHTKSPVDRGRGRKVETTPDKKYIKNPFLNYKDRRLGAVHLKITLDLHNSCSLSVVGLSCTAQCVYGQFHYLLRVVNLHLNMGTQLHWKLSSSGDHKDPNLVHFSRPWLRPVAITGSVSPSLSSSRLPFISTWHFWTLESILKYIWPSHQIVIEKGWLGRSPGNHL